MSSDALSDLLRTVRLTGAAFFDVVAHDPWVAEQPTADMVLPKVLPGAGHLIAYHVVTEGRCVSALIGGEPVTVEAGEVIVYTRGDPHVVSSRPGMRAGPFNPDLIDRAAASPRPFYSMLGDPSCGGTLTKVVCGFLACDDRPFNPLLSNLPPVIKMGDRRDGGAGWISQFSRFAVSESADRHAGGESVLAKLSELMFIDVIRRYVETLPPERAGWLAGLRDPVVGRALALLHGDASRPWTIEDLARGAGTSRSVLAERFAALVGVPPIQYLALWRMQIAAGMLASGGRNMATIAAEVGYESEASFSRAFKKLVGVPPSAWRRRSEAPAPTAAAA